MKNTEFNISGKKISNETYPYVVAELSGNHNGKLERALESIKVAKEMGADAIKFQTYTADTLTINCKRSDFQIKGGLWDGYTLYDLYKWAHTPFEWHDELFSYAKEIGITCFSTAFDETAVDLLEKLNTPVYKIASFEAIDFPLIKYVASTGKPIIISTGMSNLSEIEEAFSIIKGSGNNAITLLHCVSGYPTPIEQSNLNTIRDLAKRFEVNIGLSDHTYGITTAIASVAIGSCMIEKHFTLNRNDKGPDSDFSIEPKELKELCNETKRAWLAMGKPGYEKKAVEEESIKFRRSIYVVSNIKKGERFTKKNIRRIRPGYGLAPKFYDDVIGMRASVDITTGTALDWKYIDN